MDLSELQDDNYATVSTAEKNKTKSQRNANAVGERGLCHLPIQTTYTKKSHAWLQRTIMQFFL